MSSLIGIDLGGTKIEGVLFTDTLKVIHKIRIPTPTAYEDILDSISSLVGDLKSIKSNVKIGICTPGVISNKTQKIINSNTQCLINKSFKTDISNKIDQDILIDNDANCFTLAEATHGHAKDHDVVFGVILGTGVGGGIFFDNKIWSGANLMAGEWGHHVLNRDGNSCYCGQKGCVETYISGPALERRWSEISGTHLPLESILQLGDSRIKQWKNEFLNNFGRSMANVISILDPNVIILGGGLSNIDFLYTEGKDHIYQNISNSEDTKLLKNKLGDSAGVFGAGLLWNY
ncbi:MAG: ROK family protein [Candidatus Nitrosoabyssus spongiisocia]|nr:MAG: ROK family protein [Nitrosopumilaceae archaeon AB1(1)]